MQSATVGVRIDGWKGGGKEEGERRKGEGGRGKEEGGAFHTVAVEDVEGVDDHGAVESNWQWW